MAGGVESVGDGFAEIAEAADEERQALGGAGLIRVLIAHGDGVGPGRGCLTLGLERRGCKWVARAGLAFRKPVRVARNQLFLPLPSLAFSSSSSSFGGSGRGGMTPVRSEV